MIDFIEGQVLPNGFVNLGLSEDIACMMSSKALDFAWAKDDHAEDVIASFECLKVFVNQKTIYFSKQIHGAEIASITGEDKAHLKAMELPAVFRDERLENLDIHALDGYDAFVTDDPGVVLMSFYADCTPIGFYDPVNRVIAMAHSGWQGTVLGIGAHMVRNLVENHGTRVEDLLAVIGPTAKSCCYEVDEPVRRRFLDVGYPFDSHAVKKKCGSDGSESSRYMFDMAAMNRGILIGAGVVPENIHGGISCSMCGKDAEEKSMWQSHRRDGNDSGRMALVMSLDSRSCIR